MRLEQAWLKEAEQALELAKNILSKIRIEIETK